MKILKVFSTFNLYGGTPVKILEIGRRSKNDIIYYLYEKFLPKIDYDNFKGEFEDTNREIVEAYYGKLFPLHAWKLSKLNFHVIHTYFSFGEMVGFIHKLLNPEVKWVVSFVTPDKPTCFKSFLLRYCYQKLDGIIYITDYVKKAKEDQFPILRKIHSKIIYNGATIREIHSEIKRKAKIELLTVGGLVSWKNTILLIELAKLLEENNVDFRLTIIGNGVEWQNIVNTIKYYKLNSRVDLVGYTVNVGGYLDLCDIYLHPSLTEGFGIAVAEAMHFSKPVIVSNAGALPELVEHGYNGYTLSPYNAKEWLDKILYLSSNPDLISKMGFQSFQRATNLFHIDRFVEDHDKFYYELFHEKETTNISSGISAL